MAHTRALSKHGGDARLWSARLAFALVLALAWGLVATAVASRAEAVTITAGEAAAYYARTSLIGKEYVLAAREQSRFDCSGSVYLAWRHVNPGVVDPVASRDQYLGAGKKIKVGRGTTLASDSLLPGDLLFWSDTGEVEDIDHVAIYLGHGRILQTAQGRTSWIGSINDGKDTRMTYALRPKGAGKKVSKIDFDVFDAGFDDEFTYGDFNGDGYEDVLWMTGTTRKSVTRNGWQVAYGSATGMTPFVKVKNLAASPLFHEIAIGDFNGDGYDDVLWFTGKGKKDRGKRKGWQIAYGKAKSFTGFTQVSASALTPATSSLTTGDFNGDGTDDVLWFTGTMRSGAKKRGWQLSRGRATGFAAFRMVKGSSVAPKNDNFAYGDFNGDGADDVLWFTGTTSSASRKSGWQMSYGSRGGFGNYVQVKRTSYAPGNKRFAYGDFDGDGADDVLWFTGTSSTSTRNGWQLASGTESGFSAWDRTKWSTVSPALNDLAYGDFDGDGVDDVMWFTGTRDTSDYYWGWQQASGGADGFGYFARVSGSGFTSYEQ
ncbi:FG-GAP-like repeat-containing protein [Demequina salsinemoris]|uniref:FG-GAP-like repeat-containing protein n=1 Tax=Demequina salsinemoris TaxID=577470 RepID=UPI00078513A7|nr:FG-GAP-like repeat-containing protein [Demequina salsinemoris]